MKFECIWSKSSTNKETKRLEMPDVCKKKRCPGIFEKYIWLPDCFTFNTGETKAEIREKRKTFQ